MDVSACSRPTRSLCKEEGNAPSRAVRHSGPRQWIWGQVAGVASGQLGAANRRRGAAMDRRLLSQHRVPAQQERDLECEGGTACASCCAVRHHDGLRGDRYGKGPPAQARHVREVALHLKSFETSGAELIMGSGQFLAPKTLEVRLNADGGTRLLAADQVFLNVGTHAAIPSIPGLDTARPLTHIEALELDYLPSHLIVVGGGYVGLELAQACRRFGSRVTILQHGPQLMAQEDPDVAEEVRRVLTAEEIDVFLSAETPHVRGRSGKEVSLVVETASGERTIEGSDILVAVGRIPNTAGIGLDETGVEVDDRGYIRVNERLETSTPGIWAIGECAGSPHFTHVSVDDFRIIRDNLAGGKRTTRDRLVPYCVFTDPPLARVGLSEGEARRQGVSVRVAKLPMSAVLRTQTTGEKQGFMKALVGEDDRIVGFTMLGAEAGEVMTVVQT